MEVKRFCRSKIALAVAAISLLSSALYFKSLRNDFVWDDVALIEENQYIRDWNHLPRMFTENIGAGAENSRGDFNGFYRPVQMVVYAIDYHLSHLNPLGYHISSVVIHGLVGCTIYWVVSILFADSLLALLTALLFIAHPIHTEAVAFISGIADPLAALFMLLSFALYTRQHDRKSRTGYIVSLSCFILALLSKEVVVVFPLILAAYEYCFQRVDRRSITRIIPYGLIAAAFVALKLTVFTFHAASFRANTIGVGYRVNGFFKSLGMYFKLLLVPLNQHMEYGIGSFRFFSPGVLGGFFILMALISAAFILRRRSRVLFFALMWFLINLLLISGIYPLNTYMAEHWLYIPSLGFFIVVAYMFSLGLKTTSAVKIGTLLCLVCLLGFYSARTIIHGQYWKDAPTFFTTTLNYVSDSYKPEMYYNLGNYYNKKGLLSDAADEYQNAVRIDPHYYRAYNNLANIYAREHAYEKALENYLQAIRLKPDYVFAYANLGYTYYTVGRLDEARNAVQQALNIDPGYAPARTTMELIRRAVKK